MSRKNSFERELAKTLTAFASARRGQKNPLGRGGFGVVGTILIVLLIAWLQMRNGGVDLSPNETQPRTTVASSDSFDKTSDVPDRETVRVERCVDGDTFIVCRADGTTDRVRLIGANTPETVKPNWPVEPFGPEASAFSKRRVQEANGDAILVADGDRRDRYERRLAFLYLADSEISLNEELARAGLAKVETKYRYSTEMKNRLRAAENDAKEAGRGIYSNGR